MNSPFTSTTAAHSVSTTNPTTRTCASCSRDLFVREGFQYDYVFDWSVLSGQQKNQVDNGSLSGQQKHRVRPEDQQQQQQVAGGGIDTQRQLRSTTRNNMRDQPQW